jgi:hypothetical protein
VTAALGLRHLPRALPASATRRASAVLAPLFVAGAALLAPSPALADPPPTAHPTATLPAAPVGPVASPASSAPLAPLPVERRSQAAMSGGIASVTLGGVLLVGGGLAGVFQATCTAQCNHTPVIVGLLATGGVLLAMGIPLILYGAKTVTAPGGAVALVPRRPLPFMTPVDPSPAAGGWAVRF